MSKIRVLLADDHRMVREGLKMLVNSQADMEVVGEAGDGREAVRLAQELSPDVVLMDVTMPEMNGLNATRQLTQASPLMKVLALTRHSEEAYLQELIRAGASGYVLKQSAPSELLQAVRAVASGGKYLDPAIAGKVMNSFAGTQPKLRGDAPGELSEREQQVLRLTAWGHSNKEIAASLEISVKTVEAHKANALKKLDLRSRIDIVRYALLQGWLQDT